MGFLDTLKEKVLGTQEDEYYEDDYYEGDDGYDDEPPRETHTTRRRDTSSSGRLLGTTVRPEVESVSVYTRSGQPVATQRESAPAPQPTYSASAPDASAGVTTSFGRVTSGQLPPYVLRPVAYEDVQTVVQRVRTNQPVVLVFRNTNIECAKRILDFCFGFSYGIGGDVEELGDRVFCVTPVGVKLTQADLDKLVADGDLAR